MSESEEESCYISKKCLTYKKADLLKIAASCGISEVTTKTTKAELCAKIEVFQKNKKKITDWNNYVSDVLSFQGYRTNIPNMLYNKLQKIDNDEVSLLKNLDVLKWIFFNASSSIASEIGNNLQEKENRFFSRLLHDVKPTCLTLKSLASYRDKGIIPQWTTVFGQELVFEYLILKGYDGVQRNFAIENNDIHTKHMVDLATSSDLYEVKTSTYFTAGTANEKIFGVPWKYSDVCRLSGKRRLYVVCVGDAELYCQKWKLLCKNKDEVSPEKTKLKSFFENELNIHFVGFQTLLVSLLLNESI